MHCVAAVRRCDKGASAVEFALVLVLLMLLLTGIIQFGYTFFQYLQVEHAAREGARWASLRTPAGTWDTAGTTRAYVYEAAPFLDLKDPNKVVINVDGSGRQTATASDSGKTVVVDVYYDSPVMMPLPDSIMGAGGTIPLQATAEMRVE